MADLVQIDTDEEMDKYAEAELIASNPPPISLLKNKKLSFNSTTRRNDVLASLSTGGYVKIGEEDISREDQVRELTRTLKSYNTPFDMADYEAAGFTAQEVEAAGVMPVTQEKSGRIEPLREGEQLRMLREGGDAAIAAPRDLTMRESNVQDLQDIFVAVGLDNFQARQIAEGIMGNPNATRDLGLGLADFTPAGLFFGAQEGYQTFERGINTGDPYTIGFGALEAGLSLLEAIPLTAAGAKSAKAGIPALRKALVDLGQSAEERIAQEGTTLFSNPVGPAVDRVLAGAGKLVSKTKSQGIRAEGGLPIAQEKGDENLRLHLNRIAKMQETGVQYPGAPKNPRTVIPAPEGSDLPDIVVGNIEPDDWRQRIEATMSPEEINKAASWYKIVFGEFQKQANGDPEEIAKLTDAWFAGQQNSSPQQTLNDVLFVYEQIKRGVPKEQLKGKGLPSANKIVIDILTNSTIEGGAGQKIADFLDSGYGKNVRAIMGNKPEGGSPFVVDIHTARDTGLVDEIYINHLTRLGYDVPDDLIVDVGGGGIKGPQYESRALFGQQLTEELNDQNWMGRNDWEPAEIQAIGWMQLSGMYGGSNTGGDVVDAFTRTTRRISMEVDPGAGSPWAAKFGEEFGNLPIEDRRAINDEVTSKAIDLVNKQTGITLGNTVHGTGGWELWQNPSTVQQAIASKETAIEAGARLGYLLQQTEVWVNTPKAMTKNPKNFSIDIVETTGESLRDSDRLTELFDRIINEEPNGLFRGYQPIIVEGKPGIRILITDDAVKESPLTKAKAIEYIQEFANTKLGNITDELNFDAEIDIMEADLTRLRNNWEEDQTGGGYKSYFSGQSGQDAASDEAGQRVLDTDGAELESLFQQRINEAKNRSGAR